MTAFGATVMRAGRRFLSSLPALFGVLVFTFLLIVCAWVLFRSENFAAARDMLDGMRGLHGWLNGPPPESAEWFVRLLQFGGVTIAAGWPAAGLLQLTGAYSHTHL